MSTPRFEDVLADLICRTPFPIPRSILSTVDYDALDAVYTVPIIPGTQREAETPQNSEPYAKAWPKSLAFTYRLEETTLAKFVHEWLDKLELPVEPYQTIYGSAKTDVATHVDNGIHCALLFPLRGHESCYFGFNEQHAPAYFGYVHLLNVSQPHNLTKLDGTEKFWFFRQAFRTVDFQHVRSKLLDYSNNL